MGRGAGNRSGWNSGMPEAMRKAARKRERKHDKTDRAQADEDFESAGDGYVRKVGKAAGNKRYAGNVGEGRNQMLVADDALGGNKDVVAAVPVWGQGVGKIVHQHYPDNCPDGNGEVFARGSFWLQCNKPVSLIN